MERTLSATIIKNYINKASDDYNGKLFIRCGYKFNLDSITNVRREGKIVGCTGICRNNKTDDIFYISTIPDDCYDSHKGMIYLGFCKAKNGKLGVITHQIFISPSVLTFAILQGFDSRGACFEEGGRWGNHKVNLGSNNE